MNRLAEMIKQAMRGMSKAVFRFPFTVITLTGAAVLICYMISLDKTPSLFIEKLMFTFLVGAILGMAAQFAVERFEKLSQSRPAVYLVSVLLTAGYLLILWPAPEISAEIRVRTFVAVFALVCAFLWIPTHKEKTDFNKVALIHFKSFFTSLLYGAVLAGGLAAIIAAVDILLFNVDSDAYAYMLTFVWVLFAPIYYLSLLPKFHSTDQSDRQVLANAESYPKFLEILVSYIAIPLIAVYTLILFAYFIKILVTLHWPSGQLGPMVLIYSAVGLLVFVLVSLLNNRFAVLYLKLFPKVLIPVVIMQMISVAIRLNAYGVTESRYYVVLFGIFSITIGLLLSFKPVSRNRLIALLAAGFAIISIIPPVDAFTVSRVSQINRVENILQSEGILIQGQLTPKSNISSEAKIEVTNILSYLDRQSSLRYIQWLPQEFDIYQDMETVLGFEPVYPHSIEKENRYFYAHLDQEEPISISDYDISILIHSNRVPDNMNSTPVQFSIESTVYTIAVERVSDLEARVSVKNSAGEELIGTGVYDFLKKFKETAVIPQKGYPPEQMTLETSHNGYRLKLIFQNINLTEETEGSDAEPSMDFSACALFGADRQTED